MRILPHTIRQVIYGFIYLVILLAIGFGVFLYAKNITFVSCQDNEQNGAETGIDCGGSDCTACEIKYASLPNVEWVSLFLASPAPTTGEDNVYNLLFQIKNPNEHVGSQAITYFYELFSEGRSPVASGQNQTFIAPLEEKLMLMSFSSPERLNKVQVSLGTDIQWELSGAPIYNDFAFNDTGLSYLDELDQGFFEAHGTFLNQTGVHLPNVEIIALVFDEQGDMLSVNRTFLDEVRIGSGKDFEIIWFEDFRGEAVRVQFEAIVNEFTLIR